MILFVCHANLCRSPMAERLARRTLVQRLGHAGEAVDVVSAGTHARGDEPMHPLAGRVLGEFDCDDAGFRSRRLDESMVAHAGLILTATRTQRAACVMFDPTAVRRTFTIPQFGRYAARLSARGLAALPSPSDRLRAMIEQLSVVRGGLPVPSAEADELADPVQSPIQGFRRCAGEIQSVLEVMAELIAPTQPTPSPPDRCGWGLHTP
jgi:protein-tyrosine phosphatase